ETRDTLSASGEGRDSTGDASTSSTHGGAGSATEDAARTLLGRSLITADTASTMETSRASPAVTSAGLGSSVTPTVAASALAATSSTEEEFRAAFREQAKRIERLAKVTEMLTARLLAVDGPSISGATASQPSVASTSSQAREPEATRGTEAAREPPRSPAGQP